MINQMQIGSIFHAFMLRKDEVLVGVALFESSKSVFRVTRKLYKGKPRKKVLELVVSYGRPNYRERELIKRRNKNNPALKDKTFFTETILVKGKKKTR